MIPIIIETVPLCVRQPESAESRELRQRAERRTLRISPQVFAIISKTVTNVTEKPGHPESAER